MRKLEQKQSPTKPITTDSINVKLEEASDIISKLNDRLDINAEEVQINTAIGYTLIQNKSWHYENIIQLNITFSPDNDITITDYTTVANVPFILKYNEIFTSNSLSGIILKNTGEIKLCHTTLNKNKVYELSILFII